MRACFLRTPLPDSEAAQLLMRQSEALADMTLMDALLRVLRDVFLRTSEHEDKVMGYWEDRIVRRTHQGLLGSLRYAASRRQTMMRERQRRYVLSAHIRAQDLRWLGRLPRHLLARPPPVEEFQELDITLKV